MDSVGLSFHQYGPQTTSKWMKYGSVQDGVAVIPLQSVGEPQTQSWTLSEGAMNLCMPQVTPTTCHMQQ